MEDVNNTLSNNNAVISKIPTDIWLRVFNCAQNLSECVRMWIAFNKCQRRLSENDPIWFQYLIIYFAQRNIDFQSVLRRLKNPVTFKSDERGVGTYRMLHLAKKCSRSGCYETYREIENESGSCRYHTGRLKRNRTLSCCGGTFSTSGCKHAYHDGAFHEMVFSKRPDSTAPTRLPELVKDILVPTLPTSPAPKKPLAVNLPSI